MREYHKIETVFLRDVETKKLREGDFTSGAVEYLKDCEWIFTEKVDGTNIRVHWDGHKVSFAGRTDKAQIPPKLVDKLYEMFGGEDNETILEQTFGGSEVTLFGEGYGDKIQGGKYCKEARFILFDVTIEGRYLPFETVQQIGEKLGIPVVPIVGKGTIAEGVEYVKTHKQSTLDPDTEMEGVVAKPSTELLIHDGRRIVVKIKRRDFCR